MAQLKVTQTRSEIGGKQNHRDTLRTLGLRKIGQSVVREQTDAVLCAVRTVRHLVTAEEVD